MLNCLNPKNGSIVELFTDELRDFLENNDRGIISGELDYLALSRVGSERSLAKEIRFSWEGGSGECTVFLTDELGLTLKKTVSGNSCTFSGLLLGCRYTWYVSSGSESSQTFSFVTSSLPPRLITVGGISNVRDMGGWSVPGGKIKQGMVYRGGELEKHMTVTADGLDTLSGQLRIRTQVDLRLESNIDSSPIPGACLAKIGMRAYATLINEDSEAIREFFRLAENAGAYPMYIHCWGGADRTGCICFLLGAALGMSESDLFTDYELTSLAIWADRSVNSPLFREFYDALKQFGNEDDDLAECARKYLLNIGITAEQIQRIKDILLV